MSRFNYVLVGAGTAGCVLANRLTADPAITVLLVEAGPDHAPGREHSSIRDPYPVSLGHPGLSWPQLTAEVGAELETDEPRFSRHYLQGFGVGGGSNIQGMVALRGLPQDYDEWRDLGATGWGWDEVLPYFRRVESDLDFDGPLHGRGGPIPIRRIHPDDWAPFAKTFARCALTRGYPLMQDLNADFRAGIGPMPMANLPDQRVSASMAYLNEAVRGRQNLTILANTYVDRIEMQGRRAVAVTARISGRRESFAGDEIILSAGAIHSPATLMRSGIGPGQQLQQLGIEVVCDLPGVGQHLMNHVGMSIATYLPRHAVQPRTQRGIGQSYLQFSSGVEGTGVDVRLAAVNRTAWHSLGRRIAALLIEVHKTHSRGEVRLRAPDPTIAPEVKFNLLADQRDLARLVAGLQLCLEILSDARMRQLTDEFFLPNAVLVQSMWRRNLWNWIRAYSIEVAFRARPIRRRLLAQSKLDPRALLLDAEALRTLAMRRASPPHHVSSTCRMGRGSDRGAVVDPACRVLGIENLRVVDASIMPTLVRANTHIPVLMIAEKMADQISHGV
jgi:5-(hydroxymethyl)furfural/furfural oxidase